MTLVRGQAMSTVTQPSSPRTADLPELDPIEPPPSFSRTISVIPDVVCTVTNPTRFTSADDSQLQFQLDEALSNTA